MRKIQELPRKNRIEDGQCLLPIVREANQVYIPESAITFDELVESVREALNENVSVTFVQDLETQTIKFIKG